MITPRRSLPQRGLRAGFTLAELLVYMVVGAFVMTSVYAVMMVQMRGFEKQRETLDVRETTRSAVELLAWELRHAAVGGSQISAMSANSFTVRSLEAFGVVCAKHPTLPRYGLWRTNGTFAATADDTAMVFKVGSATWRVVKIAATGTPGALGVPACAWAGGRAPDVVVQVTVTTRADTAGVNVGAPFRVYRKRTYGEFLSGGRYWLGRQLSGSATWDTLTGPLLAPASGGLTLAYYDAAGAVTALPAALASVAFTLRPQSLNQARNIRSGRAYQTDSLTTKVAVRK